MYMVFLENDYLLNYQEFIKAFKDIELLFVYRICKFYIDDSLYYRINEFLDNLKTLNISTELRTNIYKFLDKVYRTSTLSLENRNYNCEPQRITIKNHNSLISAPNVEGSSSLKSFFEKFIPLRELLGYPENFFGVLVLCNESTTTVKCEFDFVNGEISEMIGNSSIELNMSNKIYSLLKQADPVYLWKNSNTIPDLNEEKTMIIAIIIKSLQLNTQSNSIEDISKFVFGSSFTRSLKNNQSFGQQPYSANLLELCSRIVAGLEDKTGKLLAFRENKKTTSPQKVRSFDSALAWRVHLTKASEGYRLLLWKRRDEIPYEFANIGSKMELLIEEGLPITKAFN